MEIVWTARHACNPPRAAMFLSTIAAAERLAPVGVSPAANAEMTNASEMQVTKTTKDFRTILCASMQSFALSLGKYKTEPKCGLCARSNSGRECRLGAGERRGYSTVRFSA